MLSWILKGKNKFCMLDMLKVCETWRDEMKLKDAPVGSTETWTGLVVENESLSGIKEAGREVLTTIEQLGMLQLLSARNTLRLDDSGEILFINPGMAKTLGNVS